MRGADHQHVRRARVLFCQPGVRVQEIPGPQDRLPGNDCPGPRAAFTFPQHGQASSGSRYPSRTW